MAYKTKYYPKNVSKYIGNPDKITCRSLWERRFCKYLDENINILKWGSEEIKIPYVSPIDNKIHRYYPDFIFMKRERNNEVKTCVVEIKPHKQTLRPERKKKKRNTYLRECMTYDINVEKWKAAKKFCKSQDWEFIILTEKDIF
tara:strand:+ start:422 stop:853 length:432 start_codon:yes stop_codon:yes gene_type:complete